MDNKIKISILLAIFPVLGFVIYSVVIPGQFLFDDTVTVVSNDYIRDLSNIDKFFSGDLTAGSGITSGWYRPVVILSYALSYQMGGLNPIGYHLVNIFLHIFSAILLFFIVLKMFNRIFPAFIAGIFFLIHPVQTEAVSYISGRSDLFLVFFLLISFLSFLYFIDQGHIKYKSKLLILSFVSFMLALLSKETAVVFPAILFLYYFTLAKRGGENELSKWGYFIFVLYFSLSILYTALRVFILNFGNSFSSFGQDIISRTVMFLKVLPQYWGKLLWPTNLHFHYETSLPISNFDPSVIFSIVVIIGVGFLCYRMKSYRGILLFSFGWFFISMALVSGILLPINFIIGERWLYLSAIGFFILFGILVDDLYRLLAPHKTRRLIAISLLFICGLSMIVIGIKRNLIWRDGVAFAKDTLVYAPPEHAADIHDFLAVEYAKKGEYSKALNEFRIAISSNPKRSLYLYNLGLFYISNELNETIIKEFDEVIRLSPMTSSVFNKLATEYADKRDYGKTVKLLIKVAELNPDSWSAYNNLGYHHYLNNEREKAITSFKKALVLNPDNDVVRENLELIK